MIIVVGMLLSMFNLLMYMFSIVDVDSRKEDRGPVNMALSYTLLSILVMALASIGIDAKYESSLKKQAMEAGVGGYELKDGEVVFVFKKAEE